MESIRMKDLKKVLKVQLEQGSGASEFGSIIIWGPPGIGKSAAPNEIAKETGCGCVDFRLVLCDPTDLRGIPIPIQDADTKEYATMWASPAELPRAGKGFLFFDDFTTAPPLVQASAYQITIPPHQLGPYHLPDGWVVLAASNTMKDRSLAHKMPKALSNRFTHYWLEPDIDSWSDWALDKNGPQIDPAVVGFLKWQPQKLHDFNPESSDEAFPTPRSWELVSRSMKLFSGNKSLLNLTISGQVGAGAAAEFNAFLKIQNELPPLDNIFNGDNWVPPKNRPDLSYAMTAALATRATTKQFNRLVEYSTNLSVEFSVLLVKMMISRDMKAVAGCPAIPAWTRKHPEIALL
jgi:hypothetical protein